MGERPSDRLVWLAVGVPRTAAVARAQPAPALRAVRAEHVDHGDGPVAELLVEATDDGRRQEGELGGPRTD